jgi:hypothetical protein
MRGGGRFGSDYKQRLAVAMASKKRQQEFSSAPPQKERPSVFNRVIDYAKTAAKIQEESFYPTYQATGPNPLAFLGSPTFKRTGLGKSLARTDIGRRLIESQTRMGEIAGGYEGPATTISKGFMDPSAGNIAMAVLTASEFTPGGRGSKAAKTMKEKYLEDIFEIDNPRSGRNIVPEETSIYDDTPEMANENALIDALARNTEDVALKQGIPKSELSDTIRERAYGGKFDMFSLDPTTGEYKMNLESYTLSDEGIKKQALKTLRDGSKRQEEYGLNVDDVPYTSWEEIPDWFVDRIRQDYVGKHRVKDAAGRVMSHLGLTLDHDEAVKRGGPNTLEGLVGMQGRFNFKKGDRPK